MIELSPIEPNRLKLIWQSGGSDRTKYTVGELIRSLDRVSLSYLRYTEELRLAFAAGFQGHPAFPFNSPVHHQNVMEVFSRRLPARTRNDFSLYLTKNRLRISAQISDFSLLGYTGAYLPSDGFSFAVDWRFQEFPFLFLMEVSGFRYYAGMQIEMSALESHPVRFEIEEDNPHDPNAIRVMMGPIQIGYVPRYYAPEFAIWLRSFSVFAHIERIDGALAKPQIHLFISVAPAQTDHQLSVSGNTRIF